MNTYLGTYVVPRKSNYCRIDLYLLGGLISLHQLHTFVVA